MLTNPQEFIDKWNGRKDDYDLVANVQCVDAFKRFCHEMGFPVKATLTGWADGYWWNRNTQGYGTYFDFITNPKALQKGDWCFWGIGSKSCPSSHVGMFVEYTNVSHTNAKIFSQNQGVPNSGYSTVSINLDILGAWRPKVWANNALITVFVTNLYKNILKRSGDAGGKKTWTNALIGGTAAKNVVAGFFNSQEYYKKKTTNEQFVIDCYKGYLNRNPDTSGKKHWLTKLNSGVTRQTVMNGFANSAEFKKIVAKYSLK